MFIYSHPQSDENLIQSNPNPDSEFHNLRGMSTLQNREYDEIVAQKIVSQKILDLVEMSLRHVCDAFWSVWIIFS